MSLHPALDRIEEELATCLNIPAISPSYNDNKETRVKEDYLHIRPMALRGVLEAAIGLLRDAKNQITGIERLKKQMALLLDRLQPKDKITKELVSIIKLGQQEFHFANIEIKHLNRKVSDLRK